MACAVLLAILPFRQTEQLNAFSRFIGEEPRKPGPLILSCGRNCGICWTLFTWVDPPQKVWGCGVCWTLFTWVYPLRRSSPPRFKACWACRLGLAQILFWDPNSGAFWRSYWGACRSVVMSHCKCGFLYGVGTASAPDARCAGGVWLGGLVQPPCMLGLELALWGNAPVLVTRL